MLEQHLHADKNQHDAAGDLRGLLPPRAERAADIQAGGGEQAGSSRVARSNHRVATRVMGRRPRTWRCRERDSDC